MSLRFGVNTGSEAGESNLGDAMLVRPMQGSPLQGFGSRYCKSIHRPT